MDKAKIAVAVSMSFLLISCVGTVAISDISDSMVKVQATAFATQEQILDEAKKGCALYEKVPVALSEKKQPYSSTQNSFADLYFAKNREVLFACKKVE